MSDPTVVSADLNTVISEAASDAGLDMSDGDSNDSVGDSGEPVDSGAAADSSDSGADDAAAAVVAGAEPKTQAEVDELTALLEEVGFGDDPRNKISWKKRLPVSKVKQVLEAAKRKQTAAHEAALKEHTDKYGELDSRLKEYDSVGAIMEQNPEQFVNMLKQLNPRYAELFGGQPAAAAEASRGPAPSEMPAPDIRLEDGSSTYSVGGLQRLMDWQAAQVEKRLNAHYEQQFGPIVQDYQTNQKMAALAPKVKAQLDDARTNWEGFKDNEQEIQQAFMSDKSLTLEGAYNKVMHPKWKAEREAAKADRTKLRAELLAELKAAPHSTGVNPKAPAAKADDGPKDMNEVIKDAMRKGGLKF